MTTGTWVLLIAVVAAVGFGLWRAATDGRFRGTHRVRRATPVADRPVESRPAGDPEAHGPEVQGRVAESVLAGTEYADRLGGRATLLQFSSAFCAPCRATRRTLEEVAGVVPDVAHLEVDAESHLDLVRALGVTRTPTTIVLDGLGREVTRAAGAPTKQQVLVALASVD